MGLKSITGSRKVQEIVNYFGHCIGYHTAEEFETRIAAKIIEKRKVLPDGLEERRGLSTISAWDNYDESMYHDTQGICIQNEPTSAAIMSEAVSSIMSTAVPTKKRSLELPNNEFDPVRKKPKISRFSFARKTKRKPANYKTAIKRDVAWTISCKTDQCGLDGTLL